MEIYLKAAECDGADDVVSDGAVQLRNTNQIVIKCKHEEERKSPKMRPDVDCFIVPSKYTENTNVHQVNIITIFTHA